MMLNKQLCLGPAVPLLMGCPFTLCFLARSQTPTPSLESLGTSLVVQWLGSGFPMQGLIPGQGTINRFHKLRVRMAQLKILNTAARLKILHMLADQPQPNKRAFWVSPVVKDLPANAGV